MIVYLTRKEQFNAVLRMYRKDWNAAQNDEVFGEFTNLHGHHYDLHVTIKGEFDHQGGFLLDLKVLKTIINTHVIEKLNFKNINEDVDFMRGKLSSIGTLCVEIFKQLKGPVEINEGVFLHSVKLFETENNSSEYFGDAC